jgi:hypothetical protein
MRAVTAGIKQASAGESEKPAAVGYSKDIADLRAAAKWLVVAFAAVGAVFAGGVQISKAGQLSWDDTKPRFIIAGIGVLLVVGGVIVAIDATMNVLRTDYLTLGDILDNKNEAAFKSIRTRERLVAPFANVAYLKAKLPGLSDELQDRHEAEDAYEKVALNPSDKEAARPYKDAKTLQEIAQRKLTQPTKARSQALEVAKLLDVRYRYEKHRRRLAFCALATPFGVAGFAWAANPPEEKDPPEAAPTAEVLPGPRARSRSC